MRTIRSQRRVLKELRDDETINRSQYRRYYLKAKGGSYRSIAHLHSQMVMEGIQFKGGDEGCKALVEDQFSEEEKQV